MTPEEIKLANISALINREGGYVNDPDDAGGATMYGITEAVARGHRYAGKMKELPYDLAVEIYAGLYWKPLRLDDIAAASKSLADRIFDYGVNAGITRVAREFQGLLNVLNNKASIYPDVEEDGYLGNKTIEALDAFVVERRDAGLNLLSETMNGLRMSFYVDLAKKKESQERFIYGWLSRVMEVGNEG